jgi:hypothetical protein
LDEKDLEPFVNEWDKNKWLDNKRKVEGCISIEGAILGKAENGNISFAPEPGAFSVVYLIPQTELVEVLPTNQTREKSGVTYKISTIYVRPECTVLKMETHSASELRQHTRELRTRLQHATKPEEVILPNGSTPTSAPSPSPTPAGGSHSGVSGVRG